MIMKYWAVKRNLDNWIFPYSIRYTKTKAIFEFLAVWSPKDVPLATNKQTLVANPRSSKRWNQFKKDGYSCVRVEVKEVA